MIYQALCRIISFHPGNHLMQQRCHLCFTQRKLSLQEALFPKDEQFMSQKNQDLNQGILALPDAL